MDKNAEVEIKKAEVEIMKATRNLLKTIIDKGDWNPTEIKDCEFLLGGEEDNTTGINPLLKDFLDGSKLDWSKMMMFCDSSGFITPNVEIQPSEYGISFQHKNDEYVYVFGRIPYHHQGSGPIGLSQKTLIRTKKRGVAEVIQVFNKYLEEGGE